MGACVVNISLQQPDLQATDFFFSSQKLALAGGTADILIMKQKHLQPAAKQHGSEVHAPRFAPTSLFIAVTSGHTAPVSSL